MSTPVRARLRRQSQARDGKKHWVAWSSLVGGLCVVALVLTRLGPAPENVQDHTLPTRTQGDQLSPDSSVNARVLVATNALQPSALPLSVIHLSVVEASGQPIAGARLRAVAALSPSVDASVDAIAESSVDGSIVLDSSKVAMLGADQVWMVHAASYLPQAFKGLSDQQVVVLVRGQTLQVSCRDEGGSPVAGAVVAISGNRDAAALKLRVFGWREDPAKSVPGPDSRLRIAMGVSDAHGDVRLGGLVPGEYFLEASHPRFQVVDEGMGMKRAQVPGGRVLVFAKVYAAVIDWNPRSHFHSCEISRPMQFDRPGHDTAAGGASELQLRKRFPGCVVIAALPSQRIVSGELDALVNLRVFAEEYGVIRTRVQLKPVDEIDQPVVIQLPTGNLAVTGSARWDVEPPLALCRDVPAPRIRLRGDVRGLSIDKILELGSAKKVPCGTYEVTPETEVLARAVEFPRTVTISPGSQAWTWKMRVKLRPCVVDIVGQAGMSIPLVDVELDGGALGRFYVDRWAREENNRFGDNLRLWLTQGNYRCRVTGRGLSDVQHSIFVEDAVDERCPGADGMPTMKQAVFTATVAVELAR